MKCPYCNSEFFQYYNTLMCTNFECEFHHVPIPIKIWQDLIDGKKAQDALIACGKHISDIIAGWNRHVHDHKPSPRQMVIFACRARDEITSITALEHKEKQNG